MNQNKPTYLVDLDIEPLGVLQDITYRSISQHHGEGPGPQQASSIFYLRSDEM